MIDIKAETPAALRLAAEFLTSHAALIEATEGATAPNVPAPPAPVPFPVAPAVPVPGAVGATAPAVAPTATPPANVVSLPIPSAPPVPTTIPPVVSPATTTSATTAAPELDRSGMPWDARIHQKSKGQKKDGTWKLLKNIDPALVAAVTQENHAKMINTPASVGASPAPVSLPATQAQVAPVAPPIPTTPPPSTAGQSEDEETEGTQAVAPIPQALAPVVPIPAPSVNVPPLPAQAQVTPPAPVHVPTAPVLGVPNVQGQNVLPAVSDYRALVQKISKARAENKLTQEQLAAALQAAGAPSLQLLGSMSHLVPIVDTYIDAAIASA